MARNGQSLALEHHFKLFMDLRFIKTSEHGQSLATKHHFEMFRVYFFIHTYENGQSLTSEYHLKCPRNYFFVRFSEHLCEIFEDPLFSSDIWKRTELASNYHLRCLITNFSSKHLKMSIVKLQGTYFSHKYLMTSENDQDLRY